MSVAVTVELPKPLLVLQEDPLVYPALGATFFLEPLTPEDGPRIRAVVEHLTAWLGPYLKQTNHSHMSGIEPFTLNDLEAFEAMVPTPSRPNDGALAPLLDAMEADFGIECNGGEENTHASPYFCKCMTAAYFQESNRPTWPQDDGDFNFPEETPQVLGYLDIKVPPAWPLDDFRRRVLAIASMLRLRWATAGLTYATWLAYEVIEGPKKVFSHARRHPGFDVGYNADQAVWQNSVRTTNWLTVLCPDLHRKAESYWGERFATEAKVVVSKLGDNCVIQAGAQPEGGDINRLDIPEAYIHADAMLRGVIPNPATGITFPGPWDVHSVAEWFDRFRKHVRPYGLS